MTKETEQKLSFLKNPQNIISLIGIVIILIGTFLLFLPSLIGLDGFNGGFALQAVNIMLIIPTGIIVAILYRQRAKALNSILTNNIAHWKYGKEEWKEYTEKEHLADKSDKKIILIMLHVISIITAIGFMIFAKDKKAAIIVGAVLLALNILIKILVVITVKARYKHNKNIIGETYISSTGVYLNERLHSWNTFGAQFEDARHNEKTNCIEITYSNKAKQGKDYNTVRIPIPKGKEKEAQIVLKEIIKKAPNKNN